MDIRAIVCPHCGDTYNKEDAQGLNPYSTNCLRCGGKYAPIEQEVTMTDFAFERVRACKGE